jgi:hypothetical protein
MKTPYLFATLLLVGPTLAAAQTVWVNETFADGNRTGDTPPTSLEWYSTAGAATLTAGVGSMTLVTGGTSGRHAMAYFTSLGSSASLDVGDTLTFSFNFSLTEVRDLSSGLRFGLFNTTDGTRYTADSQNAGNTHVGYAAMVNLAAASGSPASIRERSAAANNLITSTNSYTTMGNNGGVAYTFLANTIYTGVMSVNRTDTNAASVTVSFSQGATPIFSFTREDSAAIVSSFDSIAIAIGSASSVAGADSITVSNVSVTQIPEPSTYAAIFGFGALGLAVFLRRRRA